MNQLYINFDTDILLLHPFNYFITRTPHPSLNYNLDTFSITMKKHL